MTTYIIYKDMMEQSTQTNNNNEITKRKKGRPKGIAIFTEEENKERARQRARLYYSLNFKRTGTKANGISCKKEYYLIYCYYFIFVNFHLKN